MASRPSKRSLFSHWWRTPKYWNIFCPFHVGTRGYDGTLQAGYIHSEGWLSYITYFGVTWRLRVPPRVLGLVETKGPGCTTLQLGGHDRRKRSERKIFHLGKTYSRVGLNKIPSTVFFSKLFLAILVRMPFLWRKTTFLQILFFLQKTTDNVRFGNASGPKYHSVRMLYVDTGTWCAKVCERRVR